MKVNFLGDVGVAYFCGIMAFVEVVGGIQRKMASLILFPPWTCALIQRTVLTFFGLPFGVFSPETQTNGI